MVNIDNVRKMQEDMQSLGKLPSFAPDYAADWAAKQQETDLSPEADEDNSWGITRGFTSGAAGVLQGQAQLGNLMGIGDGSTAGYLEGVMQRNARKKEYTIGDMLPFASDYWTNGEGAAYDIANMLGSSVVLGAETAAAAATGGAALGALGVGSRAAAAAAAAGKSATAARATFMTDAVVNGMGRAAAKMGMPKLEKVLTGPMGKLYAINILKTPLEASSEAGNAGAEALANGASLDDAQRQALIVGGLQMPLLALSNTMESAGLGKLFLKEAEEATGKKLGKEGLLSILGSITREGMRNAWEEGMQQSTHEYAAGKQNLLGVVNPLQWSDEALQQAAVGGVGGLAIGGGNAGMRSMYRGNNAEQAAAQEAAPAEPATMTPAQQAREYVDELGQQEDKFTPEQITALREVAENGDDEAVMNAAAQFGWQNPEVQQQEQAQPQPAPVTPASTPEEQIQTATNAVNAATANVVNGNEVVDNGGEQGNSTPAQQPTIRSVSGGNVAYTNAGTFAPAVGENLVDQTSVGIWVDSFKRAMSNKLSKKNKTKKYLNADGTVNTRVLRASPALRRFFFENRNALANLQSALNGNKQAMDWVKKQTPTRQAALLDALENGMENWEATEADIQAFAKYDHDVALKNIRRSLYDKAKKLQRKEAQNLYALLKKDDNDRELVAAAEKYGVNIPEILKNKNAAQVVESAEPSNTAGTSNIENVSGNTDASDANTSGSDTNGSSTISAVIDNILNGGNQPVESTAANPVKGATTAATSTPIVSSSALPTLKFAGATIHPKLSKDGKMIGFRLPDGATLSKQELADFKAAGFAYNGGLKANIANDSEKAREFLSKYAKEQTVDNNSQTENGGNNNATSENGTRENGTREGNENPVQNQQSQEPVKGKIGDNKDEGENGKVEVATPNASESKTDVNGIVAVPHDADKATVQKLQKANTKIIMDKVNSIDKEYDDGKLTADEARKAITNFFQKYSQSRATYKVYEDGIDKKVSVVKKNITKKEEQRNRAAERAEAEAAAKAKQEAETKRKKAYDNDFDEAMNKADDILKQHQNEEMSLEVAENAIDRITEELENKLEARGDKLRVKDRNQLYERKINQLKRQQEEIDKKIYESAAIQSMADSQKKLNEDGLKVFAWVKKELSDDPQKRFKESAINAAAAMVALRAQTWTSLFNKYCGTNYTPLEYAQRYPFYLHENNIPGESESVKGLTTSNRNATKIGRIEFAGDAKTLELFHELAHAFFADFVHIAEAPDAPKRLKDDLRKLREWIGETDPDNKDLETPYYQSKQISQEYSAEERFAQAMVKHVAAADTPIEWLNDMFKEFAQKLLETIQHWDTKLKEALAKPEATDKTRSFAKVYTFDFEIPSDVKQIINEMIYYDEGARKEVTYDTQLEDLKAINKEIDSVFKEDTAPTPKVINDFKGRIAAAGRWKQDYTSEQKAVLEAAAKVASKNLELSSAEQGTRLAFDKVENGDKSESTLANAVSGLLDGNPEEMEEMPADALTVLEKALTKQQADDVHDVGHEDLARAVLSDYAVEEKLDDDYKAFVDDLREDGIEETTIKAVEKYAGLILDSLKKYQPLYDKRKALEDAQKALGKAQAALKLKSYAKQSSKDGTTTKAFKTPKWLRKDRDSTVSSINLKYKKELEQAFERNANAGDITAIQNRHQEELAKYLKEKGEKQKEKAKLRAAELRELRKKLKAHEIDSFEMAGGRVTLDKDGKEKFESIQDPNELPSFVYKNNQHTDDAYKNATATQKLNASIKRPEEKSTIQTAKDYIKNARDKFYKQWVDKYDALGILDKAIAKKGGKPADNSMTILSQMQMVTNYATGAARALVEGDENSLKPLAQKWGIKGNTSLGMIMEKLEADHKSGKYKDYIKKSSIDGGTGAQDYVNALENYLTALTLWESAQNHKLDYDREVAEWQKKGARGEKPKEMPYKFPNNLTEEDIKQIIRSAPAEFKGYQKMFKSVTDDLLNIMLKSGLITLDRYDTLKDRYKFYCPLYRDFSDTAAVDDLVTQINAGRGLGNVSDPLKSRSSEGSFRDVSAPLTNAVKSISAICVKAERNRVGQYAVKEAKKHKLDEFIREVKGNASDAKNCIFTVMFNGEKHAYQTVPELYPAITAALEPLCKIQMAVLTKPAQWLRAGSTMSPSFIIRNFLRDTIFAAVSSKNGFIPIYDSIRGGYAYLKNKQLRGEYDAAGVVSSNYYSDNEAVTKSLNEMAGGKTWQEMTPLDIAKAFVKKPVAVLEWLSELIENSTRMGEFMKARAKGKSIEQAGHDAVEVSLNFNRSGATGQQINRMVPFFNACIQGGDKMYRLFKANPRDTALKIATFIVLPSLALWAYNHDEDWYKDIDPNIKMTNWILPGGLRIPKPQEAGILFGSGIEAALDMANGQDPKAMKEWRHNVIEALTPGFLPTVILPIIEWLANYSFFRDKPIVNQAMQRLPEEMQYGSYTTESAKAIAKGAKAVGIGLSPVKIDNLWRGYTGTMGMFVLQTPDLFAAEKQNLPEKKLAEMPIARDFIINDMNFNRTMNDFYELKDAATKQHAGYGKKGKTSPEVAGVNVATRSIQKLQKEARDITASPKYNPAQKRAMIDKLKEKQNKIARAAIKKYGNKFDV